MPANLQDTLRERFGISELRPGQRDALEHILAGRDTLAVMPTGAGKSLLYQASALLLHGTTLVVSPLVALMKDQVDRLVSAGIAATYINSSVTPGEQQVRTAALARGDYKLVFVAPERFRSPAFTRALGAANPVRVAVDEAHCISEWGHDFRPDYLHLRAAVEQLGRPPILALTATATPQVQDDIEKQLGLFGPARVLTGFDRPNLLFEVREVHSRDDREHELKGLLRVPGSLVIYTVTRKAAEEVSQFAQACGVSAAFYHAGLAPDRRRATQDAFMSGQVRVIAATNAFGMGVDKADIRMVVHYGLPGTLEAYYQEAGRAGRDGAPARCVLLYSPAWDEQQRRYLIDKDVPGAPQMRLLLDSVSRAARPDGLAYAAPAGLAAAAGLSEIGMRVAVSQLERCGALLYVGNESAHMRFKLLPGAAGVDLRACAADVSRQRRHKERLLEHMVHYAESPTCRRRFILAYFGDSAGARPAACCDICAGLSVRSRPKPQPRRPRPPRVRPDDW